MSMCEARGAMTHATDQPGPARTPERSSSSGLLVDLYELTMATSYLQRDMTAPATFSLFVRRCPPGRGFLVAAGLDDALRQLELFRFDDQQLQWLSQQGFTDAQIAPLRSLRFTGDVWAVPEGHVVFPNEPLIEVTAPLPEAQLVESVLLNQLTYQTALATKAARCRLAADGRAALTDFSFRRTHGIDAGMAAARAGAIAGFAGTSNVQAAHDYGIRAVGTMAHSYVEAFESERAAFTAFAEDFPDRTTFLIDTYDTIGGLRHALDVVEELDLGAGVAVRLDSGDLHELSIAVRELLDAAGRSDIEIVASGGLDEFAIERLLDAGAPIDVVAVGTRVGTSADAPTLDSAYKLVEYDGRPMMKLSADKVTLPGAKQVHRAIGGLDDLLSLRSETGPQATEPLLVQVMRNGVRTVPSEPLGVMSDRLAQDLDLLDPAQRAFDAAPAAAVLTSSALDSFAERARRDLVADLEGRT
jgi:nicotinate phosphoribosyltransferase